MRAVLPLACGLAALLLAGAAEAADRAKVARLLDVMHMADSMDAMKQQTLADARKSMLAECLHRGSTQARCDEGVAQMLVPVGKALDTALGWDAMREETIAIYAEALTDAEVDAATAHYATPEGQSLRSKLPSLVQRGVALGQKRMAAVRPQLERDMAVVIHKLDAEDAAQRASAAAPAAAKGASSAPAAPAALDAPDAPVVPGAPEGPAAADAPDTPETPDAPVAPVAPDALDAPDADAPDAPGAPDETDAPDAQDAPEAPDAPASDGQAR